MNKKELSTYRSEVIDKFINIESLMNMIICLHYFKRVPKTFLFEVLYNPSFNFGLRFDILKKIIPEFDAGIEKDLYRLNTIRNYFAHLNPNLFSPNEKFDMDKVGYFPNPKKLQENLDFEKIYLEFNQSEGMVTDYLVKICQSFGGGMKEELKIKPTEDSAKLENDTINGSKNEKD